MLLVRDLGSAFDYSGFVCRENNAKEGWLFDTSGLGLAQSGEAVVGVDGERRRLESRRLLSTVHVTMPRVLVGSREPKNVPRCLLLDMGCGHLFLKKCSNVSDLRPACEKVVPGWNCWIQ